MQTTYLLFVFWAWIVSARLFAQEAAKPDTGHLPGDVPWVTPAVMAPRISFHTFKSKAANSDVSYHVYTPPAYDQSPSQRFPVLYWLHGTELIPQIDKSMRTIATREGRILEGFSMGGYGAARIGFKHPELFCGISAVNFMSISKNWKSSMISI